MTDPHFIIAVMLVLLNALDGLTTYLLLHHGRGREAMILARTAMEKLGLVPGLILVKGLGAAVCAFLAYQSLTAAMVMGIVLALVVVSNNRIYRTGKALWQ